MLLQATTEQIITNRLVTVASAIIIIATLVAVSIMLWGKMVSRFKPPKPEGEEYKQFSMWKLIADSISAAAIVADESGKITWVNPYASTLLGWRYNEMVGQNLTMIIPPEYRQMHDEGFDLYRKTGQGRIFGKPLQMHCLLKSGDKIPAEITIVKVENKDDGSVLFVGKIRDIRQQKQEMNALVDKVAFYERAELLNNAGGFIWDFQHDTVFMSPGMLLLFGFNRSDNNSPSLSSTEKVHVEDQDNVERVIKEAVMNKMGGYKMSFRLKTGKRIYCAAELTYNKNGNVTLIYGAVHEIKS